MTKVPGRRACAQVRLDTEMPLQKYFLFVGGALLSLLFAANWLLSAPPSNRLINSKVHLPVVRIHSAMKGPDAVVIDTSQSRMGPMLAAHEGSVAPETVVPSEWALNETLAHPDAPIRRPADAYGRNKVGYGRQQTSRMLMVARAERRRPPIHHQDSLHTEPDSHADFRMTFAQFVPRAPKQASRNEWMARRRVDVFTQAW